jgi:hypothetical protein
MTENKGDFTLTTAFFVALEDGGILHNYLITCKHVVKPLLDKKAQIYVRINKSDPTQDPFNQPALGVATEPPVGHRTWHFHDDDAVDLAVLPWRAEPGDQKPRWFATFPLEQISLTERVLEDRKQTLGEGDELVFIGLFSGHLGTDQLVPIVRFGRLAVASAQR